MTIPTKCDINGTLTHVAYASDPLGRWPNGGAHPNQYWQTLTVDGSGTGTCRFRQAPGFTERGHRNCTKRTIT